MIMHVIIFPKFCKTLDLKNVLIFVIIFVFQLTDNCDTQPCENNGTCIQVNATENSLVSTWQMVVEILDNVCEN